MTLTFTDILVVTGLVLMLVVAVKIRGPLGRATGKRWYDPPLSAGESSVTRDTEEGAQLYMTLFTRRRVELGQVFLVQVFAHLLDRSDEARELAEEFDRTATRRGFVGFEKPIIEGQRLAFELVLPGLVVDDDVRFMVWTGQTQSVQFGVTVPADCARGGVVGTVRVSRDSVPIAVLKFFVEIDERNPTVPKNLPIGSGFHKFQRAFISYASADRNEVLKRTQMLALEGIEFFQDLLNLQPGDLWEQNLYTEIDRCDVFLLFWSSAAKESEWVLKEVRYALDWKGRSQASGPEILPVVIEGPPPVAPPSELSHLHFNDRMLYFMQPTR
jgi:hypothetical protein